MNTPIPPSAAPLPKPLRAVVVDDDDSVRLPVVAMLEDMGADVLDFASAAAALTVIADSTDIALVITDVNMPEMHGVDFATNVTALKPGLPVIFMSGQAPPPGARHFIPKPFSNQTLVQAVAGALAAKEASALADPLPEA